MKVSGSVRVRPVILAFLSHYLPGYKAGGPIRTIAHMVDQLGDEFDFRIVTADRDKGDGAPFDGIVADEWTSVGPAKVFYRSPGAGGWRALLKSLEASSYDLLYLNSFFSVGASLWPLVYRHVGRLGERPVLLAPRGEFSKDALALKPAKKRAFIALARAVGFHRNVIFQASSKFEADDIRRVLGAVEIEVALDLSGRSSGDAAPCVPHNHGGPPRAVFLSRISPMKNLAGALDMLARVSCPMEFSIYGIVEDTAYWAQCQQRIAALPGNVTARYLGEVLPDRVDEVLSSHDFLLLPTLGENYGHVVREALSSGLPVLISDRTPWRDLVKLNAGADLPLEDPGGFVAWIEAFSRMALAERDAMRQAARRLGDDPIIAATNLEANRAMLHAAINRHADRGFRTG